MGFYSMLSYEWLHSSKGEKKKEYILRSGFPYERSIDRYIPEMFFLLNIAEEKEADSCTSVSFKLFGRRWFLREMTCLTSDLS